MVVYQRDDHNWTNNILSVDNGELVLDSVHPEYSSLRQVDHWSAEQTTEGATIRAIMKRVSSTQGEKNRGQTWGNNHPPSLQLSVCRHARTVYTQGVNIRCYGYVSKFTNQRK